MALDKETAVLQAVREQLDEIKVPGAFEAQMEDKLEDLDVDSLDMVDMVKSLEDRFGITIDEEALKPIKTVGDIVNLIINLGGEDSQATGVAA